MRHCSSHGLGLAVAAAVSFSSGAAAQPPDEQSVVGEAGRLGNLLVRIDVRSAPDGTSPTGSLYWHAGGGLGGDWRGRPTCLRVHGNTAVVGYWGTIFEMGTERRVTGIVRVADHGAWFDTFEEVYDADPLYPAPGDPPRTLIPAPTDCSSFPGPFPLPGPQLLVNVLKPAGLVVTDPFAPAPVPSPVKLSVERTRALRRVLNNGIGLNLACADVCRLDARLYLPARQARKHHLTVGHAPVTVGRAKAQLEPDWREPVALSGTAILSLTRKARRRLRSANAVRLVLKTTVRTRDFKRTRTHTIRLTRSVGRTAVTRPARR
jgi:hypothetical protein